MQYINQNDIQKHLVNLSSLINNAIQEGRKDALNLNFVKFFSVEYYLNDTREHLDYFPFAKSIGQSVELHEVVVRQTVTFFSSLFSKDIDSDACFELLKNGIQKEEWQGIIEKAAAARNKDVCNHPETSQAYLFFKETKEKGFVHIKNQEARDAVRAHANKIGGEHLEHIVSVHGEDIMPWIEKEIAKEMTILATSVSRSIDCVINFQNSVPDVNDSAIAPEPLGVGMFRKTVNEDDEKLQTLKSKNLP